ncbi:hypothetical protein FGO68_gene3249 [Halteria grandinella]|uniref:Ubiquitin carboxyl-terminal hydrolase n=1 Tax=Halteria grandinella TaxID=5974 RepID=A0A8J8SZC5_HALGN|nr:hypothetical protein FGO68_gene3249 [Halteria grandinella]
MVETSRSSKMWLPLESNPQVFTDFAQKLGYPSLLYSFHDVYALDKDTWLSAIPQPVIGVVLLYQIKKHHKDIIRQDLEAQQKLQTLTGDLQPPFFIKQTISNACGTIALLHLLCNTLSQCGGIDPESFLASFLTVPQTPLDRAKYLETDEKFEATHEAMAKEGSTDAASAMGTSSHFVAYVMGEGGRLWELDGRQSEPVLKGQLEEGEHLGVRVSSIVQRYIDMEEGKEIRFNVMALAPNQGDW